MPTLRDLRRATADRVAPWQLVVAGAEGPDGTRAGTAIGGDRRRIASSDLASLDSTGSGPEAPPDALRNDWAYVPSVPAVPGPYRPAQQRRIPEEAYNAAARADQVLGGFDPLVIPPDTPCGVVVVERPFPVAVPAGTEVELHTIPPLRGGRSAGIHEAVRRACAVVLIEDTVGVPGEPGRTTIDVTASFPWLASPALLVSAHLVETVAGVETYAIPGARLRMDGDRLLLSPNAASSTGQTVPVRVLRPVGTWVRPAGGVWGESTTGPIDDDDAVMGDLSAIALVAAFHIADAEAQASIVGSPEQMAWAARAATLASRTPFLRDQRARRPASAGVPWPDLTSVDGPLGGKYGPGWR